MLGADMRRSFAILLSFLLLLPAAAAAAPLQGRVSEFALGKGTRPQALAAGPDGNMWFAGVGYAAGLFTDVVGFVSPDGKVREFPLQPHTANLGLSDIAVGPDGNLWFTEGGRPKVGRITVAGAIAEFELPAGSRGARSIATGPDGNLWVSDEAGAGVTRLSAAGAGTFFSLDSEAARPAGIAAGPDGAIWVAMPMLSSVARLGSDGSRVDFGLGGQDLYPREVVVGPDSALWISQTGRSALARVDDPGGQVTQVAVPGGDQTFALSSGPRGVLWYSNGGGRIGSVTSSGAHGQPACIRSCRLPITALAEGPGGTLWFAAGVEPRAPAAMRGTIGTFAPPALRAAFAAPPSLRGRTLRVRLACRLGVAGTPCRGALRLRARMPRGGGQRGPVRLLGERRLRLRSGGERTFTLRLPQAALRRLEERGRLRATLTSRVAAGKVLARPLTLRRP